ncbi:ubiquitin-conjugating enzyme/RWD-like protein [Aspergillus floccosus]
MSPGTRRLLKEAAELRASPSPHFTAHPVSDNLYDWHFTLAGPPPPSPYAHGIYHGRIVLPPSYPLRPPSFRFLTPTGRFEVNREICLSISGHHEETWQPAWGIRTALLAIRSFMDGDARGQVGGLDVGDEVRREYARTSRGWRCEVCERSNEEILEEWREVYVDAGVDVASGDTEGESVKEKEGDGRRAEDTLESEQTRAQDVQDTPAQDPVHPPERKEQQDVPTRPTPTIPAPQTVNPEPAPPQHQFVGARETSDGPWLDRAIIGVLVALVIMILRRLARSEDPY